jgi:hypothetical protein
MDMKKSALFVMLLALSLMHGFAQFEQKITINGALGLAVPVGQEYYEVFGMETPALFSNFGLGTSIIGGIQYNHSRRISIAGNLGYKSHWGWYYGDIEIEDVAVWNLHFGLAPKLYLASTGKIKPFFYTEVSLNYTSLYIGAGQEMMSIDEGYPSIGVCPGLGFDLIISDNFGLFAQTGYTAIIINKDLTGTNNYENYHAFLLEFGIKLSVFKSKKI